jgi:hypothetical protein
MNIDPERLAHKKNGKFQCITCGEKFPWALRMPRVETTKTEDGEVVSTFEGYVCGGCIADEHSASLAVVNEKFDKKKQPRQKDIEA